MTLTRADLVTDGLTAERSFNQNGGEGGVSSGWDTDRSFGGPRPYEEDAFEQLAVKVLAGYTSPYLADAWTVAGGDLSSWAPPSTLDASPAPSAFNGGSGKVGQRGYVDDSILGTSQAGASIEARRILFNLSTYLHSVPFGGGYWDATNYSFPPYDTPPWYTAVNLENADEQLLEATLTLDAATAIGTPTSVGLYYSSGTDLTGSGFLSLTSGLITTWYPDSPLTIALSPASVVSHVDADGYLELWLIDIETAAGAFSATPPDPSFEGEDTLLEKLWEFPAYASHLATTFQSPTFSAIKYPPNPSLGSSVSCRPLFSGLHP